MANKNSGVEIVREIKVTVGGITVARDGRNIVLSQGETVLNIPNGAVATALLTEVQGFVTNEAPAKGKTAKNAGVPRKRRTKAEMEAARQAEANGSAPTASVENTVGETEEELEVA